MLEKRPRRQRERPSPYFRAARDGRLVKLTLQNRPSGGGSRLDRARGALQDGYQQY
jgi:hypothetical protein